MFADFFTVLDWKLFDSVDDQEFDNNTIGLPDGDSNSNALHTRIQFIGFERAM